MNFAKQLLNVGLAVAAAAGLVSCSIPKPECTVGQTGLLGGATGNDYYAFATRYVVKSNPNSCPEMKPELVGFQSYHPANSDGKTRDFSKTSIAIRTQNHGELFWMNEDFGVDNSEYFPNALGNFEDSDPDDTDLCRVPEISEAHVEFAGADVPVDTGAACTDTAGCETDIGPGSTCEIPEGAAEGTCYVTVSLPRADLHYKWSNVQFYVTAAAPGTQFTGDVEITLNDCTATYTAVGMWPAVDCGIHDDSFAVVGSDNQNCNPEPDPAAGRTVGSGINPDFGPTKCDDSFALTDAVEDYYINFIYGFPLSAPRCVLDTDTIPALDGFSDPNAQ